MAAGRRVGLAVPILASIYKSWIAHYFKTHYQVLQGVCGPKMTLLSSEGGAKYYDPQEARKQIHKGDFVSWTCNMIVKDKDFSFVDDGRAKDFEEAYFMAIHSNYLPLRQGDHFDVEPYSPHRFSRQFGFFQEVPGILSQDVRRASLKDGICYWGGWWTETHGGFLEENATRLLSPTPIKALPKDKERGKRVVPNLPRKCVAFVPPKCDSQVVEVIETSRKKIVSRPLEENESSNLDRYWKRPKRDSNISKPMNVDEDEVLHIEDDEASQDSQESILGSNLLADTLPIGMSSKAKLPHHAAMLVFEGERLVLNHQKEFLQKMWSDLLSFQRFDVSKVEELLNIFFSKAAAYDKARSSSSEKLSKGLLERQLKEANTRLQDAQVKESEEVSKFNLS
ncbi:UNVERIFIED_CONTAM: hypothetical protein Slati_2379100 [Sesamum latifolium]|uniref:Uncharacterized protein n=1 Tax=Sesamum latifolium TaxID=2727402 RepID=A0AAW2WE08_9LAMI